MDSSDLAGLEPIDFVLSSCVCYIYRSRKNPGASEPLDWWLDHASDGHLEDTRELEICLRWDCV